MAASAFPATAFAETSSDQSKQVSAQEVEVESRLNPETGKTTIRRTKSVR